MLKHQVGKENNREGRIPPTDTDLDVVAVGGVFEVVNGAHHIQGHVTDVVGVVFCLLGRTCHYHVGISDGLNLQVITNWQCEQQSKAPHLVQCRAEKAMYLEDAVLLAERVKQCVHGVEHGHHLHRGDVAADAGESNNVTEKNGHIWEHLGGKR